MWIPVGTRWPKNSAFHFTKMWTNCSTREAGSIIIATPNGHIPRLPKPAKQAVHVLIEKPIADTLEHR